MRVGEVGDGELAFSAKARVAVPGQRLVPVPDIVAQHGIGGELVVQADFGDAVDVAQRLGRSKSGWLSRRRSQRCR